jgi:hypothetical protein
VENLKLKTVLRGVMVMEEDGKVFPVRAENHFEVFKVLQTCGTMLWGGKCRI